MSRFSLDDLYKMTVHIYGEQNAHRPTSATFAHFVEVCGMLTMQARKKKREGATFIDALCKALGWYFPLMAKFKVASIEELVYRKFPYVCAYCRKCPHRDENCKVVRGTVETVNHPELQQKFAENAQKRPSGLNEWQKMFQEIYPRDAEPSPRSVVGLFEEVGELAEAIRVFYRFPKYLAGEAADVFSYLMGLANEYSIQSQMEGHPPLDLEKEFLQRFPGLCVQCGYPVCVCPSIPNATVGRMAKELDMRPNDNLFGASLEDFRKEAQRIEGLVIDSFGGYRGIAGRFPFDRGEVNRALLLYCLEAAERVTDPTVAETLRSAGLRAAALATYAGSPRDPGGAGQILKDVVEVIDANFPSSGIPSSDKEAMKAIGQIVFNIGSVTHVQGDNAQLNIELSQRWEEIRAGIDLTEIARQLRQFSSVLRTEAPSLERESAVIAVDEAAKEASSGNGAGMLQRLATAGKFALDVATDVGSDAIAKVISKAMGLS